MHNAEHFPELELDKFRSLTVRLQTIRDLCDEILLMAEQCSDAGADLSQPTFMRYLGKIRYLADAKGVNLYV